MRPVSYLRGAAVIALLVSTAAPSARAQLVTPRTVPVLQDEQFDIFPRSKPGLGAGFVVDDTLGDPFSNPAKATRLQGFTITATPYSHGISERRGGGRTLPIGVFASVGDWSGAVLGAVQELERVNVAWNLPTSERTATNQYFTAVLSRRFASGLSVGISGLHANLGAVDGVDLLYAGSDRIDQSGGLTDLRVGATKEWGNGHVLDLLVLRNTTNMRHDVHFTTYTWNPPTQTGTMTQRSDVNLDQTNIWGVHTQYSMPVGAEGWRLGVLGTANHLSHPKIPNYVIQNIPRDPGTTNAFNVGLGAARTSGPITFGMDVILEPMSSNTWADQATDVTRTDGSILPAGQKTVENHFDFRNTKANIGLGHAWGQDTSSKGSLSLNLGIAMYITSYELRQVNNITRTTRNQHERWTESGPTFGLRYRTKDVELSYAFRANCGSDHCDFPSGDRVEITAPSANTGTGGIIAAPSSPLFIQGASEHSHHLTIAVPIR